MNRTCLAIIALATLVSTSLMAADTTARIDINSAYVWRGITYLDGVVVQPSIDVSTPVGIGFNVWGNINADGYSEVYMENELSEIDLTLSYDKSVGPVDLRVALLQYLYPNQSDGTNGPAYGAREAYASVSMELITGCDAVAAFYCYDLDGIRAFYGSLALTHSIDIIKDKLSAEIGASAGYADKDLSVANSGGTEGGLHDYNVTASTTWKVVGNLELGANVGYTGTLDTDVLPEQKVHVYGGASASLSF